MRRLALKLVVTSASALTLVTTASAGTWDLNRIFDIGRDVSTAATGLDEKEEISVGRELAGRTLGAASLVNDGDLQTYVNRVGRWVASQSERPDLPWRFGVMNTSSVNAFAAPGGYILITRGLYDLLENESQLAGVLGHEIAHIVRRHHITVMQKSAALSAGARLAQRDNRTALVNNLIGTGAEVFARGLDKDAEFEADSLGVVLAVRAGYGAAGLPEVLRKLHERGAADDAMRLLFATHPAPGERLGRLDEALSPRLSTLPAGVTPQIRPVAGGAAAASRVNPAPRGARALQDEPREQAIAPPAAAPASIAPGVDPVQLLRGIFGR